MLLASLNKCLDELTALLLRLDNAHYSAPCAALSNASIGEHTRHILEMFQCLDKFYEKGEIAYDKRARNIMIQTNTQFAIGTIRSVQENLQKPNKNLQLRQVVDGEEILLESNYNRELLYNLEHCIHHQALIKVAVLQFGGISIDENFGVARSTIEYRSQCAR